MFVKHRPTVLLNLDTPQFGQYSTYRAMALWLGFGLRLVKPGHQAIVSQRRWPGLAWPKLARLGLASWPEAGPSTSLFVALRAVRHH